MIDGYLIVQALGFLLFAAVLLVATQDIQVFPGALLSLFSSSSRNPKTLPYEVVSEFISTADGKRLELWHLPATDETTKKPYTALIFHGNAGSLENFFLLQLWFQEQGISSYSFDYRGFGKSSGWPSEQGIYSDSDAFWNHVVVTKQLDPSSIIVCGFSVGAAPAARIASLHKPRMLLLIAAFTDIPRMVRERLLLRYLSPFLRYRLPTRDYVARLNDTQLILVHGENDSIVPVAHCSSIAQAHPNSELVNKLILPNADHNNVFYLARRELAKLVHPILET